jgi:enoyl-CoA hydratase/carnithine racemase
VRKVGADGEIWTLTIDRPEVRNAMDVEAMIELNELSRAFEEDPRARVLIITGRGDKAFCAGADLRVTPGDGPAFLRSWLRDPRSDAGSYARLLSIDLVVPTKPTIAAINGFAVGGGFELALACDLRIIDETAKVGLPEVLRGSIPAAGAIHRLVRIAGYATAADLALTGRLVAASEAMSLGLANEIAPGRPSPPPRRSHRTSAPARPSRSALSSASCRRARSSTAPGTWTSSSSCGAMWPTRATAPRGGRPSARDGRPTSPGSEPVR